MDTTRLYQDRVRERDLDNFLIEELNSSQLFRQWLIMQLKNSFDEPSDREVCLQKSPPRIQDNRQTDVRIGWFGPNDDLNACILIESKVTADFEDGQSESYAAEAAAYRSELGLRSVATVLVAPQMRMSALSHNGAFDAEITIEAIVKTLDDRLRERSLPEELVARLTTRIDLLESLCDRNRVSRWTPVTIEAKRDFAAAYVEIAAEIVPLLCVRPSTDGPKAITRILEGFDFAQKISGVTLRHEFGSNVSLKYANVQVRGMAGRAGAVRESGILEGTQYQAAEAGKALAIRVETPGIDPTLPFERERQKVRIGLEAIRDLVIWLTENEQQLLEVISPSSSTEEPSAETEDPVRSKIDAKEAEFKEALWETYRECEKLGYKPIGMLDLMQRHGAIGAVRQLLVKPPSEGFARLADLQRLDLTIESIVQQPRWMGVFSEKELAQARRRLR